jgi:hypothetical protein
VAVPRPAALRWYASDGAHLHSVSAGFQLLSHVFSLAGDSVAALDGPQRRLTIFGPEPGPGRVVHIYGDALPASRFADGTYLMRDGWSFVLYADGPPRIERWAMEISSFSEDTDATRSLLLAAGQEMMVAPTGTLLDDGSPRFANRTRPFGAATVMAGSATGFVVGDTDRAEVQFRDPDGTLRTIARWTAERRAVTSADVEAERADRLARVRDPAARDRLAASYPELPAPPALRPVFGLMLMDDIGNAWLEQFTPPGQTPSGRFEVIDAQGVWLGTVQLPPGLRLLAVGDDWVAVTSAESTGQRSVMVLAIAKN